MNYIIILFAKNSQIIVQLTLSPIMRDGSQERENNIKSGWGGGGVVGSRFKRIIV